jgi:lipopolysaccharide export system protein LptA
LLLPISIKAQKGLIELLPGTQKLSYDEKSGAQRLIGGGVNINYEGNKVYADSIYYFEKQRLIKGYGHVQIIKNDNLNLYCDSIWYFTDKQQAKLFSKVKVINDDYVLTTSLLDYDAKSGLASYQNYGKIENISKKEILTSQRGYLYPKEKNFHFSSKVRYRSDSLSMDTDTLQYKYAKKKVYFFGETSITSDSVYMYCNKGWFHTEGTEGVLEKNAYIVKKDKQICGDSLYFNDTKRLAIGKKNIHFIDTTHKIECLSNVIYFAEKEHFGYVTDSVLLIYKLKNDTLYIHSDSVLLRTDSLNKIKTAQLYWDVQVYGTKIQASCDSLILDKTINRATLFNNPILWSQNAELKADTIHLFTNDSLIEKAQLIQRSTAVMELDSGNYYNQVGGKNMEAFFKNNELIRVEVNQNAQTNYFPQDTIRTDTLITIERKGMARLYASDIRVYLDSGEVIGITYFKNPDGAFYPIKDIPEEEKFVKGFSFNPKYRPKNIRDLFRQKRYFKTPVSTSKK